MHLAEAGGERRKGADDGDEAGDDDGPPAVLHKEVLRLRQVVALEPWPCHDPRTALTSDPVVQIIADDGSSHEQRDDDLDPQQPLSRKSADGKEQ